MSVSAGVCAHIEAITEVKLPEVRVCEACVKIGSTWVHLRTCQTCGIVLFATRRPIGMRENMRTQVITR
jgi:hypothetical protein